MINRRLIVSALFILTAVMHLVQPFLYGISTTTIGYIVFGLIYLSLGILQYNNKPWMLWISIILPALGLVISLFDYFILSSIKPSIYPLLVVIDIAIIILCITEFYSIKN